MTIKVSTLVLLTSLAASLGATWQRKEEVKLETKTLITLRSDGFFTVIGLREVVVSRKSFILTTSFYSDYFSSFLLS
jgi:hypothetical protein